MEIVTENAVNTVKVEFAVSAINCGEKNTQATRAAAPEAGLEGEKDVWTFTQQLKIADVLIIRRSDCRHFPAIKGRSCFDHLSPCLSKSVARV